MNSSTILSDIKAEVAKEIIEFDALVSRKFDKIGVSDDEKQIQCEFATVKIAMLDFMLESFDVDKINSEEKFNLTIRAVKSRIRKAVDVLMS